MLFSFCLVLSFSDFFLFESSNTYVKTVRQIRSDLLVTKFFKFATGKLSIVCLKWIRPYFVLTIIIEAMQTIVSYKP